MCAPYEVVTVGSGADAVAQAASSRFDAVLMDVEMPVMNGFDATAAIRQADLERGTHTVIIALTAHAMAGDAERCRQAGMDDYVTKPLSAATLRAALERQSLMSRFAS